MAKTNTKQTKDSQKTMSTKKEIKRKRSTLYEELKTQRVNDPEGENPTLFDMQDVRQSIQEKTGRKQKFDDPDELLLLFNLYLTSIQEKKTVSKKFIKEIYEIPEEKDRKKKQTKTLKGITRDVEIKEVRVFKELPTRSKFYVFIGGCTTATRKKYQIDEEFFSVVSLIDNFFEAQLESGGLDGSLNPGMVQFTLNHAYGRNPKIIQETEQVEKDLDPLRTRLQALQSKKKEKKTGSSSPSKKSKK